MATKEELEKRVAELVEKLEQQEKRLAELEAHEKKLRFVVEKTSEIVWNAAPEGRFTEAQPAWSAFTGQVYEEYIGGGWASALHMDDRTYVFERWMAAVESKVPIDIEYRLLHHTGEYRHTRTQVIPILSDEGELQEWVGVTMDISEKKNAEIEREKLQQEIIEAQRRAIQELSTPVIPVMDQIIVMPLVGSIDSIRARDITRSLLAGINTHRAKVVILDVTGVGLMDTGIVNHLNKTIQAARLKGAQTILTGVSDAVAETIVDLGINWGHITTLSDLQTGLITALNSLGIKLSK